MHRVVFTRVFAFVVALLCWPGVPAGAQSDTGEIKITVVDSNTSLPISDARTILVGPQTASSLTTRAGIIDYTDVPIGIYRVRVVKRGYTTGVSTEFDVLSNRAVAVRVALALSTGGLKEIGNVTARSNVTISSTDISENSPIRRLSDSLTDALDKVAGVSVTQDSTDPNSAVTVSLNGHDESQTSVSLDGIPLSAPGSTANLRSIGTDLFSGSSVSTSPSAGSLGGGVNFRTLQPTQSLQIRTSAQTGTFDRSNESIAATGSIGNLGIALLHTWRDSNSPLTFQDYQDQSGLTYPHEGESQSLGDFVKFRYRLNDERTTISGTALTNNQHNFAICARDVTLLPCGIGPGNENDSRYGFAYGTIQSLVGTVATQLTAYTSSSLANTDYADRYALLPNPGDVPTGDLCAGPGPSVPGTGGGSGFTPLPPEDYEETPCPSLATNSTVTRGLAYIASIAEGKHTLTLTGNTYSSIDTSVPIAGSQFETAYENAISSTSYQISDAYKVSDRLTLSPRLSVVNTTTLGTALLGGVGATWRPRAQDSYGASVNIGSSQPNIDLNRSFSDPVGARFDCQAETALVSGPGDTNGGGQSAVSFDANWTHQFLRSGGQVSLDAYSQVQTGQLISANIAEPTGGAYFPAGYLQTLYNVYQSPNVCGTNAAVPSVYVTEPVGGTRRIYQGLNVSGRFGVGRYFVVLPNYTLNVAELTAASSRLEDGPSTTIVGQQLPNRPLHRAGVTFDGFLPRGGIELLANAQYTGANNQQNLGPYTTFAAGISHGFGPGVVTFFENNIFNTYGGLFATDAYADPLPLSSGDGVFRTAATPLLPRTFTVSYTVNVGGPKPGSAFASVASRTVSQNSAPAPQPNASAGPGGRGGLGQLQAIPPPPGTDPLALATTRTTCDADAQTQATPVFAAFRAYVTAYETKQALPDVPNITVLPHALGATASIPYYLELRPKFGRPGGAAPADTNQAGAGRRGGFGGPSGGGPGGPGGGGPGGPEGGPPPGGPDGGAGPSGGSAPTDAQREAFRNSPAVKSFRGFIACNYVTVLAASEAKAKGIDIASGRPSLLYVPKLGFVFVRAPELPQGGGSLKQTH
jgi:hypothetical protein